MYIYIHVVKVSFLVILLDGAISRNYSEVYQHRLYTATIIVAQFITTNNLFAGVLTKIHEMHV